MAVAQFRARILCVDDEPDLLEGLSLLLRRSYDVTTATSAHDALGVLEQDHTIAVIVSDMRMPGVDGAAFLSQAREMLPDAVRILLTGQSSLSSAITAVNEGQVFRFLTKPCDPAVFRQAVDAAVEQHRLLTAERVLLEETLHGSIEMLADVLAIANPISFARATRAKKYVSQLMEALGVRDRWQVEVAALLSQVGWITLPVETASRMYYGDALSDDEQAMVARLPDVTDRLLKHIPRLEVVRGILATYTKPFIWMDVPRATAQDRLIVLGAQVLKAALDFDGFDTRGLAASVALGTMRARGDYYNPQVLEALEALLGAQDRPVEVQQVPLSALRVGMVLADDVKLTNGVLLAARGYHVTAGFVERARNFKGSVEEPLRVFPRSADPLLVALSPIAMPARPRLARPAIDGPARNGG